MIFTGRASEGDRYFNLKIKNAREKIKEFPFLSKILGNFEFATKHNYHRNIFMNLASSAFSDPCLSDKPNKNSEDKLKELENTLSDLVPKLTKNLKRK